MSCQQEEAQKRLDRSIMYIEDVVKISASEMKGLSADIAAGAKPSALSILLPDLDGRRKRTSALVVAASIGAVEVVSLFLQDAELDVNVADTDGFHALLAALRGGRRQLAALDHARSLQPLQPLRQHIGRQAAQVFSQIAETTRPHHEFSDHQQGPALADQVQPVRRPAGVVIPTGSGQGLSSYFF